LLTDGINAYSAVFFTQGVDLCEGVECPAPAPCRLAGVCGNGVCSYGSEDEDTPCDDGNPLTDLDRCTASGNWYAGWGKETPRTRLFRACTFA
jgi:hypothetical protein